MKCLIYFLSDKYQQDLRRLAQLQTETYEAAVDKYKDIYISHLKYMISDSYKCEKCNLGVKEECDKVRMIISEISFKDIGDFFDSIKSIYINWIDGNWNSALQDFRNIMIKHNLMSFVEDDINKDVLFRGRENSSILTKYDMFHIPFNKRFLIGNQRYSLTGQPMIYLGGSVIDIVEELEIDRNKIEELNISTYKIDKKLKIYDLRNNIYRDVINKHLDDVTIGENETSMITFNSSVFFKNLLASMCSFVKRREHKNYSFCEEYVVPQILAQTLKNDKFNGIAYYSTKKFKNISFTTEVEYKDNTCECTNNTLEEGIIQNVQDVMRLKYKENIAMFTNFNNEHVYDQELFKQVQISKPISIDKIEEVDIDRLKYISHLIGETKDQRGITNSEKIISEFEREFGNCQIDGKNYYETYEGRLHIYHIYIILNNIYSECKKEVDSDEKIHN